MMIAAIIGWQIFIFITTFISGSYRGWVAAFWVLWTLLQIFALPLSIIQFCTIFYGYKLAGLPENLKLKSSTPATPKRAQSETHIAQVPQNEYENTATPEKVTQQQVHPTDSIKEIIRAERRAIFRKNLLEMAELDNSTSIQKIVRTPASEECILQDMNSAYITKHNFNRIASHYLQSVDGISIDKIFSALFEKNLSDILNKKEATKLYFKKQMLENNFNSFIVNRKNFTGNYTFSVNSPKFHKDKSCAFLKADFTNYLIPPAIKNLGEVKIKEFQDYCESRKKELEKISDDVFWARIGIKFNVNIKPERVIFSNSGVEELEKISIDDLREKIKSNISQMLSLINNETDGGLIINFRYAPSLDFAISKIKDQKSKNEIINFFQLKFELLDSLLDLYKKQTGKNSYVLPISLLKECDFEPCKICSN